MLRISEFGIVELTRQRMRPSLRKSHFVACPHCDGHGEIKSPETVGGDATRQVGYLLQFDRVRRVEMVCSPRVASVLLSAKRRELVRLEDESGKKIDVRVSDAIALDRVDFYAYDDRNADIDISKLPSPSAPTLAALEAAEREPEAARADTGTKKRRRRRKSAPADATAMALAEASDVDAEPVDEATQQPAPEAGSGRKKRRRRRKPAAARGEAAPPTDKAAPDKPTPTEAPPPEQASADKDESIRIHKLAKELGVPSREVVERAKEQCDVEVKSHMSSVTGRAADLLRRMFSRPEEPSKGRSGRSRRRGRGKGKAPEARQPEASAREATPPEAPAPEAGQPEAPAAEAKPAETPAADAQPAESPAPRKRRRSRRSRGRRAPQAATEDKTPAAADKPPTRDEPRAEGTAEAAESPPKRRTSSRRGRKKKQRTEPAPAAAASKPSENGNKTKASGLDEAPAARDKTEPAPPAKSGLYRSRRRLSRPAAQQLLEEKPEE
jgi:ribonuclease E